MKITAEQVGIDSLGELMMVPKWPDRPRPRHAQDLAHTAPVRTIYTDLEFVLSDPLSIEGLRPLEDFRKVLIARSMADITVEEYYRSLVESEGFMRVPPAVRNRIVQTVAKKRELFPAGYHSDPLYNSGGTGTGWTYNPPIDRELSDIHDYMLELVSKRSER